FDFGNTIFPQAEDPRDYQYNEDGLLQANGVAQDSEIRNPQHLDIHGKTRKCLLVVRQGMATGTTVGHVNGLESFTRMYNYLKR
ncbi:hypothetical protein K443DRAFT_112802, partial [Laccaria amethystina LaAM-08-1]